MKLTKLLENDDLFEGLDETTGLEPGPFAMNEFFEDCLELPFRTNSQDNPLHELQVEELLIKHGLPYKAQPNGIQNSPDFHVFFNGKTYSVECKSSKQAFPTYNGGLPKPGAIYVFSSAKYNETTIYFAEDVVSNRKRELFQELMKELNDVLEKFRELQEWKGDDDRGFDFYIRNMFIQKGGADKTDYFKHPRREACEQRVLNYRF